MKTGRLTTSGDAVEAAAAFLKGLLEGGIVDEVLVPAAQPGGGVAMAAFADAASLSGALAWAPVMPVQGARMVSRLAFTDPGRVGGRGIAALRGAGGGRAHQAEADPAGAAPLRHRGLPRHLRGRPASHASGQNAAEAARTLLSGMKTGETALPGGVPRRAALPARSARTLRPSGARSGSTCSGAIPPGRSASRRRTSGRRRSNRRGLRPSTGRVRKGAPAWSPRWAPRARPRGTPLFAKFSTEAEGLEGLKKVFATCIRCLNCMENCPICYCKLCIFKSPTFDHPGERYARWAKRKGAQKMPAETMLFHLTRLNHMASSCIGCGLCDTACPMGLPVATLFRKVAGGVQGMLEYVPGRSLEDPIPLTVFREDELQDESGARD